MPLQRIAEHLNGIQVLQPSVFKDQRGYFVESFSARDFASLGLPTSFPQDNHSRSIRGVIRGMHFQWDEPMGKLLRVVRGAIRLVEVDIRHGSPTLGQHIVIDINDDNNLFVWVPPGFANGFQVVSDEADVYYKCTTMYNPKAESGIRWDSFGMDWGAGSHIVSDKDLQCQSLDEWLSREESHKFTF